MLFLKVIGGAQQQGQQAINQGQQLAGQGQAAIGGAVNQGQAALGGIQSKSLIPIMFLAKEEILLRLQRISFRSRPTGLGSGTRNAGRCSGSRTAAPESIPRPRSRYGKSVPKPV